MHQNAGLKSSPCCITAEAESPPALDVIIREMESASVRLYSLGVDMRVFADNTVGVRPEPGSANASKQPEPASRVDRALLLISHVHDEISAVSTQFHRIQRV